LVIGHALSIKRHLPAGPILATRRLEYVAAFGRLQGPPEDLRATGRLRPLKT
jgi:hypothetical protein